MGSSEPASSRPKWRPPPWLLLGTRGGHSISGSCFSHPGPRSCLSSESRKDWRDGRLAFLWLSLSSLKELEQISVFINLLEGSRVQGASVLALYTSTWYGSFQVPSTVCEDLSSSLTRSGPVDPSSCAVRTCRPCLPRQYALWIHQAGALTQPPLLCYFCFQRTLSSSGITFPLAYTCLVQSLLQQSFVPQVRQESPSRVLTLL